MINTENLNTQEQIEELEILKRKIDDNISEYFNVYYVIKTIQLASEYADYMDEHKIYPNNKNNRATYVHAIAAALEFVCQYTIEDVCNFEDDIIKLNQLIDKIIENTSLRRIK